MLRRLFAPEHLLNWLLVFVPAAVVLRVAHADPLWTFLASCLGIVPLAGLMGQATEALAVRAGPGIGGLLNASFGNAAELIIAWMALRAGQIDIVQASITGSIVGNLLFVLGLAIVCGCARREKLTFNRTAAGIGSSTLFLGVIGLLIPTLMAPSLAAKGNAGAALDRQLQPVSLWIAGVLLAVYGFKLLFSLRTHHHLYSGEAEAEADEIPHWRPRAALAVLGIATTATAMVAEILVGAVEHAAGELGLSRVFVGVVVVAIVGNAAEHSTAVMVAMKGKMNLALTIAVESSLQIALFVAPALVLGGLLYRPAAPMTLHFTDLEAFAVAISMAATALISMDGETNWLEGVQLLAVYAILAVAFYFI